MTNNQFIEICEQYEKENGKWLHPTNKKEKIPFYNSFKQYCINNLLNEDDKQSVYAWLDDNTKNYDIMIEKESEKENIVKQVCAELDITQKELAERIGISPDSLNVAVSNNKISKQTEAAINLVAENARLKAELNKFENLKNALKDAIL